MTDTNGEPAADKATPPPPTPAEEAPAKPARAGRSKVVSWIAYGLVVLGLAGATAWMYYDLGRLETENAAATVEALELGQEKADILTEIADLEVRTAIDEADVAEATAWLRLLSDDVVDEAGQTDRWREVAIALNDCSKARKKIVDDIRAGKSTSSAESKANKQCKNALADYKGLGG